MRAWAARTTLREGAVAGRRLAVPPPLFFSLVPNLDVAVDKGVGVHVLEAEHDLRQEHAGLLLGKARPRRRVVGRRVDAPREGEEEVPAPEVPVGRRPQDGERGKRARVKHRGKRKQRVGEKDRER